MRPVMSKHHSRGQALIESALCFPLLMLACAFMFWCTKFGVLNEESQLDVRYSQQTLQASNLFDYYSLPALYDAVSGAPSFDPKCLPVHEDFLNGSNVDISDGVSISRSSFWKTSNITVNRCKTGLQMLRGGSGYSRDIVMSYEKQYLTFDNTPPLFAQQLLNNSMSVVAPESIAMFSSATVMTLYQCFNDDGQHDNLGSVLRASLIDPQSPQNDPTPQLAATMNDVKSARRTDAPTLTPGGKCT